MAPVRSYDVHAPSVNGTAWEADLREDRTDIGFRCRNHRAGLSDLGHVRDLFQRRRRPTSVRSAWRTGEGGRERKRTTK